VFVQNDRARRSDAALGFVDDDAQAVDLGAGVVEVRMRRAAGDRPPGEGKLHGRASLPLTPSRLVERGVHVDRIARSTPPDQAERSLVIKGVSGDQQERTSPERPSRSSGRQP
jgi:hypothetical protein